MKYKNSKVLYLGIGFLNMGKSQKDYVEITPYAENFSSQKHGFLGPEKRILDSGELGGFFDPGINSTSNSTIDLNQSLNLSWSTQTEPLKSIGSVSHQTNQTNSTIDSSDLFSSQNQTNNTSGLESQGQTNQISNSTTNQGNSSVNTSIQINGLFEKVKFSQVPTFPNSTDQNLTSIINSTINQGFNTTNQTMNGVNSTTNQDIFLGGNQSILNGSYGVLLSNQNNQTSFDQRLLSSSYWNPCNVSGLATQTSFSDFNVSLVECDVLSLYLFILNFVVGGILLFTGLINIFFSFYLGKEIEAKNLVEDILESCVQTKIEKVKISKDKNDQFFENGVEMNIGASTTVLQAFKEQFSQILEEKFIMITTNNKVFNLSAVFEYYALEKQLRNKTLVANTDLFRNIAVEDSFSTKFNKHDPAILEKMKLSLQNWGITKTLYIFQNEFKKNPENHAVQLQKVLKENDFFSASNSTDMEMEIALCFKEVSDIICESESVQKEKMWNMLSSVGAQFVIAAFIIQLLTEVYNISYTNNNCLVFEDGNYRVQESVKHSVSVTRITSVSLSLFFELSFLVFDYFGLTFNGKLKKIVFTYSVFQVFLAIALIVLTPIVHYAL